MPRVTVEQIRVNYETANAARDAALPPQPEVFVMGPVKRAASLLALRQKIDDQLAAPELAAVVEQATALNTANTTRLQSNQTPQ